MSTDRARIHEFIPRTEWKLRENVQLQRHKPFRLSFCQRDLMAAGIATGSKGKGKVHPRTGHNGPEGELRYISTLSLTSLLDGGGWSTPRRGRFTPWKEIRYPSYKRLGGPQARSGRVRKISPTPEFDPRTVQPVASRYTDYANPAHTHSSNSSTCVVYCMEQKKVVDIWFVFRIQNMK